VRQSREDAFFKEISAEPTLRKGHPLTHLVTAQSKMDTLGLGARGLGARGLGAHGGPKIGASPYLQTMALVEVGRGGEDRSKLSRRERAAAVAGDGRVKGEAMSASSAKHRDFLLKTLHQVLSVDQAQATALFQ
jgi:hypothetical protein